MVVFDSIENYLRFMVGLRPKPNSPLVPRRNNPNSGIPMARNDYRPAINIVNQVDKKSLGLTAAQVSLATRLITKYKRRLAKAGVDVTPIENNEIGSELPLRVINDRHELVIEDGKLALRFRYNRDLVNRLEKIAAKKSAGKIHWLADKKKWVIEPTPKNILTLVDFAASCDFAISDEVLRLRDEIYKHAENFKIELTRTPNGLTIKNASPSLIQYVEERCSITEENLLQLCFMASECAYTISDEILLEIADRYGNAYSQIFNSRVSHVKRSKENFDAMIRYAKDLNQKPVVIFSPENSARSLAELESGHGAEMIDCDQFFEIRLTAPMIHSFLKEQFGTEKILVINGRFQQEELAWSLDDYDVIFTTRALPRLTRVPLLIVTSGLAYRSSSEEWIRSASRVIRYCEFVLTAL